MVDENENNVNEENEGQGQEEEEQSPQPQPHNFDRGLQRLQQSQAADRRTLHQVAQTVQQVQEQLSQMGSATAQEKSSEMDDALAGLGEDGEVNAEGLKKVLQSLQGSLKKELTSELKQSLDDSLKDVKEQTRESQTERYWREWEKNHPSVATQKDELLDQATEAVDALPNSASMTDDQYAAALQAAFNVEVQNAEKEANNKAPSGKKGKEKEKEKTGPSDKPPKSTKGAEVTPRGSKGGGTEEKELREPGPLWVPDGEE